MECEKVRKKLKQYASDEITDPLEKEGMEAHITGCPVCKRELLMWQEVLDRQKMIRETMPNSFSERVKKRAKNMNAHAQLPPIVRRMQAVSGFISSPKGCLLMQIIIVMLGFLGIFTFVHRDTGVIFSVLVVLAFGSLFFLLLRKKGGKGK